MNEAERPLRALLLNGSNLNMLGQRDPRNYGVQTLAELEADVIDAGRRIGFVIEAFQSNAEGVLIDALHDAHTRADAVIFNPGGYSHTSIALRDAIEAIPIPVYEVHISNIHAREEFRHRSLISAVCAGTVSGFGAIGYVLALHGALDHARRNRSILD